jgi:tight adherence protein C
VTTAWLGAAWAALVLWTLTDRRPPPRRFVSLAQAEGGRKQGSLPRRRRAPIETLGSLALRLARRPPSNPAQARIAGAAVVASGVVLVVAPVLLPIPLIGAWALPRLAARRDDRRRLQHFEADLPETVDLLAMAVGAGCNVTLAVEAAGHRGTGPLAAELRSVTAEVGGGRRLADALDELPARAGESVRPLAAALAGCERYGAPLGTSLERIADHVRRQRQRRAEEAARKVPVMLLFPLVLCILPAFALLTVAPLIAGALHELRL